VAHFISNQELALAQGFDRSFSFSGKSAEVTTQIGNSVSPPNAMALTQALLSV
jgi:site-specific DNA-cytosine methylase